MQTNQERETLARWVEQRLYRGFYTFTYIFDLYKALSIAQIDESKVIECYHKYMDFVVDHIPTYKEFIINMDDKMKDDEFLGDTTGLLRVGDVFNPENAYELVRTRLIDRLIKGKY